MIIGKLLHVKNITSYFNFSFQVTTLQQSPTFLSLSDLKTITTLILPVDFTLYTHCLVGSSYTELVSMHVDSKPTQKNHLYSKSILTPTCLSLYTRKASSCIHPKFMSCHTIITLQNIPKKPNKKLKTNEIFEKPASCDLFHWLGHRFYKMVFHFLDKPKIILTYSHINIRHTKHVIYLLHIRYRGDHPS